MEHIPLPLEPDSRAVDRLNDTQSDYSSCAAHACRGKYWYFGYHLQVMYSDYYGSFTVYNVSDYWKSEIIRISNIHIIQIIRLKTSIHFQQTQTRNERLSLSF